ncbi:competence type IV pilus minor pilin ComGF [Halalkalibacterium ligniniphilum]|uniref:competence type IV pilus minor pilin ComGF n=1 Tax=Halalkalibacterium ligniniphilum TaxID=1134413 RepID=UPI00034D7265|nr:competence type IV pilus minor pilin ComGF [Halalkalibacterium ligniniphilum]
MKYVSLRKDNQGFTLAEMLLSLSFVMMLLTLSPLFLSLLLLPPDNQTISRNEARIFLNQLVHEANESVDINFHHHKLSLRKGDGTLVTYEYIQGERIRRQVNQKGQEMVLFGVGSFQCNPTASFTTCTITDLKGQSFQRQLAPFYKLGVQGADADV